MKHQRGFTIIELIVVISIIGLIVTIAIVKVTDARKKARDAKRIGDISQIHKALEMRFEELGTYPSTLAGLTIGKGSGVNDCTSECTRINIDGIVNEANNNQPIYMGLIPADPSAITGVKCDGSNTAPCHYVIKRNAAGDKFTIDFFLEKGIENLDAGSLCLTESGFLNFPCQAL